MKGRAGDAAPAFARKSDNIGTTASQQAEYGYPNKTAFGITVVMKSSDLTIEEFAAQLKPGQRLVGLDLGTKTIGIALSDIMRTIATPVETWKRQKFTSDAEHILKLAASENAGGIVIGLPLNMDGSEGPRAQSTRAFVRNMHQKTDLPIVFWDERLSTSAVTRILLEADRSRAKRAKLVDKLAATYILQGAMDRINIASSQLRP